MLHDVDLGKRSCFKESWTSKKQLSLKLDPNPRINNNNKIFLNNEAVFGTKGLERSLCPQESSFG